MKIVSKLSYYSLLTIVLRVSVNMTNNVIVSNITKDICKCGNLKFLS